MSELTLFTAAQLAAMIREHRVSAVEVLEAHLAHIAKHNPRLNAIVTLDEAKAHERARQADAALARGESWSALHGVPVTIKDAFETAGLRTTSGYKPWSNYVPQNDAPAVARLRQAGAIILGKTNLPALAAGSQTVNDVFGRTNNPWSVAYTPGGSTGGGAAAVAVGLSPLELGSDISGSIRAPAHFCGIFGLKPTSGRISVLGHRSSAQPLRLPQEWRGLLQLPVAGPLARSVADLRLALTVLADPGTPALEPAPPKPLRDLRIAWTDEMSILPISADTRAAIQTLACKLSDASATVARHTAPNIDYAEAWELAAEALATINTLMQPSLMRALRRIGSPLLALHPPSHFVLRGFVHGAAVHPERIVHVLAQRDALITQIERFFDDWDVWIAPAFPRPAFTHRPLNAAIEIDDQLISQDLAAVMSNVIFNFSGHPAVVVPIGFSREGLPIGAQVVGRRWSEMALLDAAEQIAEVADAYRRPPEFG
jgi:amidase